MGVEGKLMGSLGMKDRTEWPWAYQAGQLFEDTRHTLTNDVKALNNYLKKYRTSLYQTEVSCFYLINKLARQSQS